MKNTLEPTQSLKRYVIILVALGMLVTTTLTGCTRRVYREIDLTERIDDAELAKMAPKRDTDILRFGFDLRLF